MLVNQSLSMIEGTDDNTSNASFDRSEQIEHARL